MKKIRILLIALLIFFSVVGSTWSMPFSSMYVFGDSLSDGGSSPSAVLSIYKLLGGNCDPSHPCPPYFEGRYSNGVVAAEYLAQQILPVVHQLTISLIMPSLARRQGLVILVIMVRQRRLACLDYQE